MSEDKLKSLKTNKLTRTLDFLSVVVGSGQKALTYKLKTQFGQTSKESLAIDLLKKQIEVISEKFGNLKGGLMKVGQMLSVYGEYFLPPDVNNTLKSLQYKSKPFDWETLNQIVTKELSPDFFNEYEIEKEAIASASLGQVHVCTHKINKNKLALKIQYPNVDKAVQNDISALKAVLNVAELFPQVSHMDLLFDEVKSMLSQELDYINEMKWTQKYRQLLKNDPRFIVPIVYPEWTTNKIISTSYEPGVDVDSDQIKSLSQERRNQLALSVLELYFLELFKWGFVQTDPHIGNFKIRPSPDEKDQVILYDFGATREFSNDFLKNYRGLIAASLKQDRKMMLTHSVELKFVYPDDPEELVQRFLDFCVLMVEPFQGDVYDWSQTDLPKRLTKMVGEVITQFKVRAPPREVVFLDRKTTGVFIFLSILGAKINAKELLESYLRID